jgi:hypothetical protein
MADVSSNLYSWSTTASSNSPSGATNVGSGLDDNLRQLQATVREGLAHYNSVAVASAGTVDLGAQTGNFLIISGTTTITAFGTVSAGIWKVVRFSGALTLTHNGTSLILPGAANITTVAGDVACFLSEGSGNWRCVWYQPTDGRSAAGILIVPTSTSPAQTTDGSVVWDSDDDLLTVGTGATRKTMVDTNSTQTLTLKTLTSPTLTTPTINGAAAGTTWAGHQLQMVNTMVASTATGSTSIPQDDSIPQNTEGTEAMTLAITPTHASNKLRIDVVAYVAASVDTATVSLALFQDTTANGLAAVSQTISAAGGNAMVCFTHYMAAGTTSSTTFKVRIGVNSGNWTFNPQVFGGIEASSITITEIKV